MSAPKRALACSPDRNAALTRAKLGEELKTKACANNPVAHSYALGQEFALEGTPAIRAWFTHVFANFRVEEFGLQPATIEQRGDIAIEHGNWRATFQPRNGSPQLPAVGTYLTIYARQSDGSVRMIRDTFNGMPG